MLLSSRVKETKTSITLKVNEKINQLTAGGRHIYNMTSGQLHVKPSIEFIESISKQLNFSKSYQYSPIAGMKKLREKFMDDVEEKEGLSLMLRSLILSLNV